MDEICEWFPVFTWKMANGVKSEIHFLISSLMKTQRDFTVFQKMN